jgi:fructokinase/2-dehydro-3-deoxygluconokinase
MGKGAPIIEAAARESFDVICAGEPQWRSAARGHAIPGMSAGLLSVAKMLALADVHVGLATVLDDDRVGRASLAEVAALGVAVSGVKLAPRAAGVLVVDASGAASCVLSELGTTADLEIPAAWASPVLLLSGLSAVTSRLAAYCKAERRARRDGALVVLDAVGGLRHWAGRDPRVISMVLREADVVRCSSLDLAVIGTDSAAVRRAMRSNATLVLNDDATASALGPFGEVKVRATEAAMAPEGFPEACTAAICAEFARPQRAAESLSARWHRILRHETQRLVSSWPLARPQAGRARF